MDYKEGSEELVNDATHIAKGKRTKRLRLLFPNCGGSFVANSSCNSSANSGGGGGADDRGSFSISSTTTTDQEEEEDMANCLILLAQGGGGDGENSHHQQEHQRKQVIDDQDNDDHDDVDGHGDGNKKIEIKGGRKFSDNNKVGFYIYECKTCNRTFPSFQALGGHRASHKKPKLQVPAADERKLQAPATAPPQRPSPPPPSPLPSRPQVTMNTNNYDHHHFEFEGVEKQSQQPHIKIGAPPNPISLQFGSTHHHKPNFNNGNNKANKIHECSICGSEFTSGQALGGHMRRHRASSNASTHPMSVIEGTLNATAVAPAAAAAAAGSPTLAMKVQPRNILELDLNLPAPEEDLREPPPKFQFTAAPTQKSMVLSAAPALVDCHY